MNMDTDMDVDITVEVISLATIFTGTIATREVSTGVVVVDDCLELKRVWRMLHKAESEPKVLLKKPCGVLHFIWSWQKGLLIPQDMKEAMKHEVLYISMSLQVHI